MIKLIGILVIVVGFMLKLDTIAVVVVAGLVTGLASGMAWNDIVTILGKAFVENRYMTIFIVSLPAIGLLERYGLRERAAYLISRIRSATAGRVTTIYLFIRTISAVMSVRLGGHVQFIRPLILPMSMGAAENRFGTLDKKDQEKVKGLNAAVDNYANFFGQNGFVAAGGVLLIVGVLKELKIPVEAVDIATASLPMAGTILVVATAQFLLNDRRLAKKYETKPKADKE